MKLFSEESGLKNSVCLQTDLKHCWFYLLFAPSKLLHINALKIKSKALTAVYSMKVNIERITCNSRGLFCRSFPGIFGTQQEHYLQVIKQMLWQCLQDQTCQQVQYE